MRKYLLLIVVVIFSCKKKSFKYTEPFILKYSTGKVYCKGTVDVFEDAKMKNGIWNYYWLNGNLKEVREYFYDDLISLKKYYENGKIMSSRVINSEFEEEVNYTEYFENGNIRYERITEISGKDEYDDAITDTKIKTYYDSGQLHSLNEFGEVKIWNRKNDLVIKYDEY